MKRRPLLLLAAVIAAAFAFRVEPVAAQTKLRYAHVGSEGDIQYWFAEEAGKRIPAATQNQVAVTVFPNSQLGGVQETIDGVRSGAISVAHHEFASLAKLVPDIAVFNAPFVYRDGAHALKATDPRTSEVLHELNQKLVANGNMRIIGRLFRGARQMTAKMAVYSPDDLKGKPFRGVPIQLWTTMIKGFGAIPTPVEVSELPTALMTGMVIGQENPLTMINANKLYEVQSHVMLTAHMQNVLPVFMNENAWKSLSKENQDAIVGALDKLAYETLDRAQTAEKELVAGLQAKGMTFITEKEGLKLDAFRQAVVAEVNKDFPAWSAYIQRIAAIQ